MSAFARIQKILYQPLTFGAVLSFAGIAFFLLAVSLLINASDSSEAVSVLFRAAGWLVVSGRLLQQCEAGAWPFRGELSGTISHRTPQARPQGGLVARVVAILCLVLIAASLLLSLGFGH